MKYLAAIICLLVLCGSAQELPARRSGGDRVLLRSVPQMEVATPADQPAEPIREKRTGKLFASLCIVNSLHDGVEERRFVIHVPDAAFLPFGQRAARFLALVWAAADRRWGRLCSRLRQAPIDVWLTREGAAGGEQVAENLYLYNLASERTGIEWARELAHEYGHYLLPAASGYLEPESWPNGVLGERLFLKWLLEDVDAGRVQMGDLPFPSRQELEDYCAKQVDPLIERFRTQGPKPDLLVRTDRRGFDAFTGLLLGLQDLYGPEVLMDLLEYLPRRPVGLRATDFLAAFTAFADQSGEFRMNIPQGGSMAYVPKGRFLVRLETGPAAAKPSVEGCVVKPASEGWILTASRAGWRNVTGPPQGMVLLWHRLDMRE
ncbi:MAG: hypothetical protein ACP5VE_12780 [Chthonomonadales bacterium]